MIQLFQSQWTAMVLGTIVYLLSLLLLWRPLAHPPSSPSPETLLRPPAPSWAFHSPEVDALINELKLEKDALAVKEKELKDLALRLQTERAELGQITQTVQQMQSEFDQNITRVRQEETPNLKRLAKTYSGMTPEGSAAVFKALDDSTVVKVMMFMKETETAPILEIMAKQGDAQAKRVASISEHLRLGVNNAKKGPGP